MRKRLVKAPKASILIMCSTPIEEAFFSQMRKDCRFGNMSVRRMVTKTPELLITKTLQIKNKEKFSCAWVVLSLQDLGLDANRVSELEELATSKKLNLAWAAPSIVTYWDLHYEVPGLDSKTEDIVKSLQGKISGLEYSEEYLGGNGSSLHLRLFPNKAKASANASIFNQSYRIKNGIDAINYTNLINSITEHCGEADISYNQRTVASN